MSSPDGGKLHADHWSTEYDAHLLQTSERKRATYARILHALRIGALGVFGEVPSDQADGLTDDQLRAYLGRFGSVSKSGPATRRGELVEMGLVRPMRRHQFGPDSHLPTVVKRSSDLGNPMIVWELVPAGEVMFTPLTPRAKSEPAKPAIDPEGLERARAKAEWEIGDPLWGTLIVEAYLGLD